MQCRNCPADKESGRNGAKASEGRQAGCRGPRRYRNDRMARMRYTTVAVLLLAAALTAACSRKATVASDDWFRTQLDEDWKYWMTQYPEAATLIGYPGQNSPLDGLLASGDRRAGRLPEEESRAACLG